MTDHVRICGLAFESIIGVFSSEREQPQPLVCNLELELDLRRAGRTGRIGATIDYADVAREIETLVQFRRYRLLEAAAEEVAAMLMGLHPGLQGVGIELRKPSALAHRQAVASVAIQRTREDFPMRHETPRWGQVDVLLETRDAGLYLLHVEAGRTIPDHHHAVMRELEWLARGSLWRNGLEVQPMTPVAWEAGQVHGYENRSDSRATLFCCDIPPFIPEDEIEVRS